MKELMRHLCESCGSPLAVDIDRQIYICSFCGVTYDYAYFKEDDVLGKAETFLERGETNAAMDAYKFYLTKNPHDGDILKKVMLLTYGLSDIDELKSRETLENFTGDPKETDWVLEQAPEDRRDELKDIHDLLVEAGNYHALELEVTEADNKVKAQEKAIDNINKDLSDCYYVSRNEDLDYIDYIHPKRYLKILAIVGAILLIFILILIGILKSGGDRIALAYLIALITGEIVNGGIFFIKILPDCKKIGILEKKMDEAKGKLAELESQKQDKIRERDSFLQTISRNILKMKS